MNYGILGESKSLKRAVVVLILALISGVLILTSNFQPVEAVITFYIRPDGSIWPMEANTYIMRVEDIFYHFMRDVHNPIVVQRSHIVIDEDGHKLQGSDTGTGLHLQEQSNVTIRNTTIKDWYYGVYLNTSSLVRIVENHIARSGKYGIRLKSSNNTIISGNNITHNHRGIHFHNSRNNMISGNNIMHNDYGVYMGMSGYTRVANNTIFRNRIENNTEIGVWLTTLTYCSISRNDVKNNSKGIVLSPYCRGVTVSGNNITDNINGTIVSWWASASLLAGGPLQNNVMSVFENKIYHNNFINNTLHQATVIPDYTDAWDDGATGNFWSDYTERYPGAVDSDGDGIWDTPYIIGGENIDRYPLVDILWMPITPRSWDITGPLKWVPDGKCDMRDVALVAKLFGSLEGDGKYDVRADITGPTYLVPDGKIDMRDVALVAKHYGEIY